MIKTLNRLFKQDKEKFVIPKGVQDTIPIMRIYEDGIFQVSKNKFTKTYKFEDINYAVASEADKEARFLQYSQILNAFDIGATTKITINNRKLDKTDLEKNILVPDREDKLSIYKEDRYHKDPDHRKSCSVHAL